MNKTTNHQSGPCPNEQITVFEITGNDAQSFLNNQTVSDLSTMDSHALLTAICNPKGRILFTLFIQQVENNFLVAVDRSLASVFSQYITMRRFRQDVQLKKSDQSLYLSNPAEAPSVGFKAHSEESMGVDSFWLWMFAAGMPWVTAETSEHFIPQHVNLDQLQAIGFDKGCYPGQEIVARLHFLGKVKKRMRYIQYPAAEAHPPTASILLPGFMDQVEMCSPSIAVDGVWHAQAIAKV